MIHCDTNESIQNESESIHGDVNELIQYKTESIPHDVDESIHHRDESIQSYWFCVSMADNMNTLFLTYLPTGRLETSTERIKYWVKLKTSMNYN